MLHIFGVLFFITSFDVRSFAKEGAFCPVINLPNGKYEVLGQDYTMGAPIPNYAVIKFSCNTDYALYPANALANCLDGKWYNPLPECRKTCPPRISSSVDVMCTVDGQVVDCGRPMVEGTVTNSTCKYLYVQSHPDIPISKCSDGSWDNPLIRCVPECGEEVPDGTVYVVNGVSAKKGEFPWHVGIYHYQHGQHDYQCGGSIITPEIILTTAQCFTDADRIGVERNPAEEYYVAAGKYYSDYNSVKDKLAQRRQVKEYHIPPEYRGFESRFAGDLAVVVLVKPFQLTNVVLPVCVEWQNIIEPQQLKANNIGSVVGWGYVDPDIPEVSTELKQLNAPFIDVKECLDVIPRNFRRWVTPDKFCAGFTNGSSICKGDNGGGIVFKWKENNRQRYYLRGLASLGPVNKGSCEKFQYAVYTKISDYYEFILQFVTSNTIRTTNCPALIKIDHGKFVILGQSYNPGTPIQNYAIIKFSCNTNYALHPANPLVNCVDGIFTNPIPQCKLTCPPIISSTVDVSCTLDNNFVNCSQPLVDGAVATSNCKPYYTQSGYDVPITTCTKGSWNKPLITCIPECGEMISKSGTFVVDGTSTKTGEFPWHIALYRLEKGNHEYKCGGSIINPIIIITAAHCLTDEIATRYPADEFYIGAGKYYSDYNSLEDKFAQKRQVKEYYIPMEYKGYASNYGGDLAVVVVRQAFQMSNVVQPVCVDWQGTMERYQLKPNNTGAVVGWGYVDPNERRISAELKRLNPPYIDGEKCFNEVSVDFRRWITWDKFCAGFRNGTSICQGDSGGGLVFKWHQNEKEKYFLRGVVSVGPVGNISCDNFQYGVYTKISYYMDKNINFILNIINENPINN